MAEECQMNIFLNFDIPTVTEPYQNRDLVTMYPKLLHILSGVCGQIHPRP